MSKQSQLSTFNFERNSIRTLVINNEPWFVAKDICEAIGIDNNRKAILALDEDEKGVTLSNTLGGQQEMNIVSESGMYTLILRCRDAVKKGSVPYRFRKWVTAEVLPTIRKTGSYNITEKALPVPTTITPAQQQAIQSAVQQAHHRTGLNYQEIYRQIKAQFAVAKYDQLQQDDFEQAMYFIQNIVNSGVGRSIPYKENRIGLDEMLLVTLIYFISKTSEVAKDLNIISRQLLAKREYGLAEIAHNHAQTLTVSSLANKTESIIMQIIDHCQYATDQKMYHEMLRGF